MTMWEFRKEWEKSKKTRGVNYDDPLTCVIRYKKFKNKKTKKK